MKATYNYFTIAIMALMLSACGKIDLSINKQVIIPPFVNPFSVPASAEIVAGAVQDQITSHGYHVNATSGTMIKSVQSTTVNGYKVSYGLDGELAPQ